MRSVPESHTVSDRLRVAFYTRPCFLDPALPLIKALSRRLSLHVFLELSPEGWNSGPLGGDPGGIPSGVTPADAHIDSLLPAAVRGYWEDVQSFHLVVHRSPRTVDPRTALVSRQAALLMRRLGLDLVHLDDVSPRLALASRWLPKGPAVLTVHDPKLHTGDANWRIALARQLMFAHTTRYLVHSPSLVQDMCVAAGVPADRVSVAGFGPLTMFNDWPRLDERAVKTSHENGPCVLFFGRLSAYKGLEVLIEAARLVASEVPSVRFVVAGGPVQGYTPPAPPALPAPASFQYQPGRVATGAVASLFEQASVVVIPYTEATQSGAAMAARAFGKTIVASAVGGLPDVVADGVDGLLVPPGDPRMLADALVRLLKDDKLRNRMEQAAADCASSWFSWDRVVDRTLEAYGLALETARGAGA